MKTTIRDQVLITCRSLLSEINRDPTASTYGCFDRRFWAWKITDFPEATFQRNLLPLAWYAEHQDKEETRKKIRQAVCSGLTYTFRIQHEDGSFDQAYPNEHSYGATAFILADLIQAYKKVKETLGSRENKKILEGLERSADFLCRRNEEHSVISNHLAGAALGLHLAGELLSKHQYTDKAKEIIQSIIKSQSEEGWYPEYGGADPGYQTLCMYYLASIQKNFPQTGLLESITKSIDFLKYFIHPDGSFGGEYGSRRTEIYYPGGISLLAAESETAKMMHDFMLQSIESGNTVTLMDLDMGNTAPLLSNYIQVLDTGEMSSQHKAEKLPFQTEKEWKIFEHAGVAVISHRDYYCILGASSGGVAKIFNKANNRIVLDDCGILGKTVGGKTFSTQVNQPENRFLFKKDTISMESRFYIIDSPDPSPTKFFILRFLNLTLMKIRPINEWTKKILVGALIKKQKPVRMESKRLVKFLPHEIQVIDEIRKTGKFDLEYLRYGEKFSAIHMATARYFHPGQMAANTGRDIDIRLLNDKNQIETRQTIKFAGVKAEIDG